MFFSSFDANYRSGMTFRKFNGNDRTALSCFSKGFLKLVCVRNENFLPGFPNFLEYSYRGLGLNVGLETGLEC